jgi:hypothetical protein
MDDRLLLGVWRTMVPVPKAVWQRVVKPDADLAFMSADHHRVRDFVVRELPRTGAPIPPAAIAEQLDLPSDRLAAILDELEEGMTFLFRNDEGAVQWAYPVTVEDTPHRVTFSTGETVNAA